MTILKTTDGGYYAIKGFEFQVDKAIFDILNSPNDNDAIKIEQIQDINSDDLIMQVKYRETQNFSPTKIKEPVIQLIKEFSNDVSKRVILYTYFKNSKKYEDFVNTNKKITKENLDKILGKKKGQFTDEIKNKFINKFILDFAPTFQEQFEKVITKLKEQSFVGSSYDEAVFYYANIADYLRKLVVNNKHKVNRICTKKQIIEYLKNGKKLVFNSAFKEYKGEQEYYKFIKSKFVKAKKNQENFVFIGDVKTNRSVSISDLIIAITEKHYDKATYDIKPLTFIIPDALTQEIKKDIIERGLIFNDGYEHIQFNKEIFSIDPVTTKKTVGNGKSSETLAKISFRLRLLSWSKFTEMTDCKIEPKMIYYFDSDILKKYESISFLKIDNLDTKQISDIFIS